MGNEPWRMEPFIPPHHVREEKGTIEISRGPITFDVKRAREHGGFSAADCEAFWYIVSHAEDAFARMIAERHGRTHLCPACEQWTTPGECIHCTANAFVPYPVTP